MRLVAALSSPASLASPQQPVHRQLGGWKRCQHTPSRHQRGPTRDRFLLPADADCARIRPPRVLHCGYSSVHLHRPDYLIPSDTGDAIEGLILAILPTALRSRQPAIAMMCDPSNTIDSELALVSLQCRRNLRRRRWSVELHSGRRCHLGIIDSDSNKHCVCDPRGLIGPLP